jgi:hypothetical protein
MYENYKYVNDYLLRCFMITRIKNAYVAAGQKISATMVAPTEKQARAVLFMSGLAILAVGLSLDSIAQQGVNPSGTLNPRVNTAKITGAVNAVMTYLEGSFGALIMAAAGVGAIMSAAFGQYKAALSLMAVAVGSFILRSLISTFFNDTNIQS